MWTTVFIVFYILYILTFLFRRWTLYRSHSWYVFCVQFFNWTVFPVFHIDLIKMDDGRLTTWVCHQVVATDNLSLSSGCCLFEAASGCLWVSKKAGCLATSWKYLTAWLTKQTKKERIQRRFEHHCWRWKLCSVHSDTWQPNNSWCFMKGSL